jgi:hypothetical protein
MRALRPTLEDPTDVVYQGEQMRAAVLRGQVTDAARVAPLLGPILPGTMIQADGVLGPETLDGPIPPQMSLPFDRAARPQANAGIMTSDGFVPIYANECNAMFCPRQSDRTFRLTGVTRDSSNAALGNCIVRVFDGSNLFLGQTTSDGSGNYSFDLPNNSGPFYVVAWDAATGLITGASPRTLSPAEV